MAVHIKQHRDGFDEGFTAITTLEDAEDNAGIALGVQVLPAGTVHELRTTKETAWLLMAGTVDVTVGDENRSLTRASLFDESASALHVSAETTVRFSARADTEFTVYEVANEKAFAARFFTPDDVANEHRGQGQVGDACYRFVRTIFDDTNSPKEADLVLGEVITFPGRWSSYPPHHHAQPELYHYRFTHPQGFGHSELGDDVLKVRAFDTVKIFPPNTHAQCAAPGYGMYYAWVIRHLEGDRYTVPTFEDAHDWTRQDGAEIWSPKADA